MQFAPISKLHFVDFAIFAGNIRGGFLGVDRDAEFLDFLLKKRTAAFIDLDRHEARGKFDDVGLESHELHGVGAL